jgi:hypothetical protein
MTAASQYVTSESRRAADKLLRQAAKFTAMHATSKPLLQKTMRLPSTPPVVVRMEFPGVLRVFDAASGELLAQSLPGRPAELADMPAAGFAASRVSER